MIDPVAGSGSTLRAAAEMRRNAYGFEIDRNFYNCAKAEMLDAMQIDQMSLYDIENDNQIKAKQISLWESGA